MYVWTIRMFTSKSTMKALYFYISTNGTVLIFSTETTNVFKEKYHCLDQNYWPINYFSLKALIIFTKITYKHKINFMLVKNLRCIISLAWVSFLSCDTIQPCTEPASHIWNSIVRALSDEYMFPWKRWFYKSTIEARTIYMA